MGNLATEDTKVTKGVLKILFPQSSTRSPTK